MLKRSVSILKTQCIYSNIIEVSFKNSRKNIQYVTARYCHNQKIKCWKCGVEKKSLYELFCDNCKIIQEPKVKDNYFQVLGIKEQYNVDLKSLSQKYRQMQGLLHPDKFSTKYISGVEIRTRIDNFTFRTNEEKHISEEYSSIVNTAYNTILSPINRGLHLLALKGVHIDETDKNEDQDFLMMIMELNEEIEEAKSPEQLLNLNKKNRKELENIARDLSEAFNSNDIIKAKKIVLKMKYYTSIASQINNILRERGIVE